MTTMLNWYFLGWLHASIAAVGSLYAYRIWIGSFLMDDKSRKGMPPDSVGVILFLVGALILMAAGVIG